MDRNQVNAIYDRYSGLPVQRWRTDLIGSIDRRCVDGIDFPGMPPEDLQRHLQGNSNEIALRGALAFREHCVRVLESNDYPLGKDSVLLDFGSGWGRIARAFMRDVPASNIFGLEPFDFILEARKANTFINFVQTSPLPPLPFRDGFATHIVTWSTFTHFNEDFFVQWLAEFARVLRPNGVCFITTLGISFLNNLQKARAAKAAGEEPHFWIDLILKRITADEVESAKQRIATGEFVWLASTQVARAEFAECFVTDAYVRRRFGDLFEVISKVHEPNAGNPEELAHLGCASVVAYHAGRNTRLDGDHIAVEAVAEHEIIFLHIIEPFRYIPINTDMLAEPG